MSELDGLDEARDDESIVPVLAVRNAALVRFMGSFFERPTLSSSSRETGCKTFLGGVTSREA